MTSSATETAIQALIAALTTQAAASPAPFPVPTRNNTLPDRMTASVAAFPAVTFFFNLVDGGKPRILQETLGNPDVVPNTYELENIVELELVVQGPVDADREGAYDAAVLGINAALAVDRSLGGAVEWCQLDEPPETRGLVTDALPNTKGAVINVRLDYLSSLPY
jgi:hypothetical protein